MSDQSVMPYRTQCSNISSSSDVQPELNADPDAEVAMLRGSELGGAPTPANRGGLAWACTADGRPSYFPSVAGCGGGRYEEVPKPVRVAVQTD